jgi:hypothetical protein
MTSFAFILGVLPLVIAKGAGSEMRQALGTTVFFGMIGVTFFGLFLTPVFFVSIRYLTERAGRSPSPFKRWMWNGHPSAGAAGNAARRQLDHRAEAGSRPPSRRRSKQRPQDRAPTAPDLSLQPRGFASRIAPHSAADTPGVRGTPSLGARVVATTTIVEVYPEVV